MPEQLWFTALLNKVFGGPITAFLDKLPPVFHPTHPEAPITNAVAMEVLVVATLILVFLFVRSRLSVDKPGSTQHLAEMMNDFIAKQGEEIIGHGSERFVPFLVSLFLFILFANLIGLIPGFISPSSEPAMPLGCAVVAFTYYNLHGLRVQGLGYIKHFMGPVWWLAWLILPIEVISTFARVMSLTIRLYANIFAGDMVTGAFFALMPVGIPVVFLLLHVAVSGLQAYIFVLLTTIYLQGAVAQEH